MSAATFLSLSVDSHRNGSDSRWLFPDEIGEVYYLDYETRAKCDLARVGVSIYAAEAEVLVTALCRDRSSPIAVDEFKAPHRAVIISWGIFDFHIYRALHGRPALWIDASAIARYLGLPSGLDACGKILGFGRKDRTGEQLIRQYSRLNPATQAFRTFTDSDRARFTAYALKDVELLRDAWNRHLGAAYGEFCKYRRRHERLTFDMNERGIGVDRPSIQQTLHLMDEQAAPRIGRLKALADCGPRSYVRLHEFLETDSVARDRLRAVQFDDPAKREVSQILLDLGGNALSKLPAMLAKSEIDGRVRDEFVCGATITGRFKSRGVQVQNLKRSEADPRLFAQLRQGEHVEGIHVRAAENLRGFFVAGEGHEFIIEDFSQIETRTMAWLAGEGRMLEEFSRGDPYVSMAAEILNKPVDQVTRDERMLGKVGILGCQYGAGPDALIDYAAKQFELDLDADLAATVVNRFRSTYPRIRRLWWECGDAAMNAVRHTGHEFLVGRIGFRASGRFLAVRLPSGRRLRYPIPRLEWTTPKWDAASRVESVTYVARPGAKAPGTPVYRKTMWGGVFAQHANQAIAADLLLDAMARIDDAGLPLVLTAHDEIVIEVPTGSVSEEEVRALMCQTPRWAEGIPIEADGFRNNRYCKSKPKRGDENE